MDIRQKTIFLERLESTIDAFFLDLSELANAILTKEVRERAAKLLEELAANIRKDG